MIGDSLLELIITEAREVKSVVTDSRHIARALRIALEERDRVCCVPGCGASNGLEADHWQTDYAKGGKTSIENLALLCRYHHHQKTNRGWRLEGPPGRWRFIGPDRREARGSPVEPKLFEGSVEELDDTG
jgi:HNH endonuclease